MTDHFSHSTSHIDRVHLGLLAPDEISPFVDSCWFGKGRFSRAIQEFHLLPAPTPLEVYVCAIAFIRHREAGEVRRLLDGHGHRLGHWGIALDIEVGAVTGAYGRDELAARLSGSSPGLLRAYLLKSLAISLIRRGEAEEPCLDLALEKYSESIEYLSEALAQFEAVSPFEAGRIHLMLSRTAGSPELQVRHAKSALMKFRQCHAGHYARDAETLLHDATLRTRVSIVRPVEQLELPLRLLRSATYRDDVLDIIFSALSSPDLFGCGFVRIEADRGRTVRETGTPGESMIRRPLGTHHVVAFGGTTASACAELLIAEAARVIDRLRSKSSLPDVPPVSLGPLKFYDPALHSLADGIRRYASIRDTAINLLLLGEQGTGKSSIARAVHEILGQKGEFIEINCADYKGDATMFQALLFGARKGAYTGLAGDQTGALVRAVGGTVFLDEIGDLEPALQGMLLKVLEERTVQPLGSGGVSVPISCRIIAATNKDVPGLVREGRFRADLLGRFHVSLLVPPLRETPEQIVPLARDILKQQAEKHRHPVARMADEAARFLKTRRWTTNVRGLKATIVTADAFVANLADSERIITVELLESILRLNLALADEMHPHLDPPEAPPIPSPNPPVVSDLLDVEATFWREFEDAYFDLVGSRQVLTLLGKNLSQHLRQSIRNRRLPDRGRFSDFLDSLRRIGGGTEENLSRLRMIFDRMNPSPETARGEFLDLFTKAYGQLSRRRLANKYLGRNVMVTAIRTCKTGTIPHRGSFEPFLDGVRRSGLFSEGFLLDLERSYRSVASCRR